MAGCKKSRGTTGVGQGSTDAPTLLFIITPGIETIIVIIVIIVIIGIVIARIIIITIVLIDIIILSDKCPYVHLTTVFMTRKRINLERRVL